MFDQPIAHHQGEPFDQRHASCFERRQPQRAGQAQLRIAQKREWQVQSLDDLTLNSIDWVLSPNTPAPNAASSWKWSRNEQAWGVQPRAPGMPSQPSGSCSPGRPVLG